MTDLQCQLVTLESAWWSCCLTRMADGDANVWRLHVHRQAWKGVAAMGRPLIAPGMIKSALFKIFVSRFADRSSSGNSALSRDSDWNTGSSSLTKAPSQQCYEDVLNTWPPLTSLLRLLDTQGDRQCCLLESRASRGAAPQGRERRARSNTKGPSKQQPCKKESQSFMGQGLSLDEASDNIPLRKGAVFPDGRELLGCTYGQLHEQLDADTTGNWRLRPRADAPSDPPGDFCSRATLGHRLY